MPSSVATTRSRPRRPVSRAPISTGITRYGVTAASSGKVTLAATATAVPSSMATEVWPSRDVSDNASATPAIATTTKAPGRNLVPATAANDVSAATVKTLAARATRSIWDIGGAFLRACR